MQRGVLDLGSPPAGKTLTERHEAYGNCKEDPHLEMLLFQFDRWRGAMWARLGLTSASIHSLLGNPVVLRLPMTLDTLRVTPEGGETFSVKPNARGRFEFPTKAGGQYQLAW